MPSKGFNSLTLSECETGCRYEAMRQQWFEQRGDRQRALQAYRNQSELFDRLQWLASRETELEEVA